MTLEDLRTSLQNFMPEWCEIERLRRAITRLAQQEAPLSVCDGNVTVTMDATLTGEEREAVERAAQWMVQLAKNRGEVHSAGYLVDDAATLRGLLERTGGER